MSDRNDPLIRQGALLLSYLALTPNDGLESFAQRKVAYPGVTAPQLATLRNVLDALGFVVASVNRDDWRRVDRAWEALKGVQRPQPSAAASTSAEQSPKREETTAQQRQAQAAPIPSSPKSAALLPVKPSHEPTTVAQKDIGSTAFLSDLELAAVLAGGATPFRAAVGDTPPPSFQMMGQHDDIGGTTTVSAVDIDAAVVDMLTPQQAQLPMSVQDYAQLVSRTEPGGPDADAEGRQRCHAQLHISDEAHRTAIDATFRAWLRANEAARRDYEVALTRWRQWLHAPRT